MMWKFTLTLTVATTALAVPLISAPANCTREALLQAADAYIATQTSGRLDALQKFTGEGWTYVENNKQRSPNQSVLTKAMKIDNRRTNVDTVLCATYSELIITDAANPYVIGTQIHHGADMKIRLVDSVASTKGSWLFDSKKTLSYVLQEKWDPIPEAKWDSRALIQAAGDAYMDLWSADTESKIPWGTPCTRLEGSAYTGKGRPDDSCKPGIPSNHKQAPNSNRRYVIDQSMGSVSILCVWEHMMMAADSHEFRLENGKLRYVHTMTECGGKTCRL